MIKKVKNILGKLINYDTKSPIGTSNESARRNWLQSILKKIPANSRILDAGAGEQQFKSFCSHLNYVSQDFAQYNPAEINSGLQMNKWSYGKLDIISDISSIPEKENSFDAIMCTEVFEHIINPREALREFSRLLKKDGFLIITAPFCSLTHFAPYHFYTGFNIFFYNEELKSNGFKIIEMIPNGSYFEYLAQEIRRIPSVAQKYSGKSSFDRGEMFYINKCLQILDKVSKTDKGSSELLCHGYHVLAQKI